MSWAWKMADGGWQRAIENITAIWKPGLRNEGNRLEINVKK